MYVVKIKQSLCQDVRAIVKRMLPCGRFTADRKVWRVKSKWRKKDSEKKT